MKKIIILLLTITFVMANTNTIDPDCIKAYLKYTKKRNARIHKKLNRKQYALRNVIFFQILTISVTACLVHRNDIKRAIYSTKF